MSSVTRKLRLFGRVNWIMTAAIGVLLVIGVFFVYSSGWVSEEDPVRTEYLRQMLWVAIGIMSYVVFSILDYRQLGKMAWWISAGCIFLLVLVLIVGDTINGARSWLMFFGIRLQPSEAAKIAMIIVFSRMLSRPDVDLLSLRTFLISLGVMAVPVILIALENDLGTAMIFVPVALIVMFVAGLSKKYMMVLLLIVALLLTIVVGGIWVNEKMDQKMIASGEEPRDSNERVMLLKHHQRQRILVFLNLKDDRYGSGWNKRQSKIAVGSGGVWGKGFKNGTQNILGFLPRNVAPTDFIYSVIAEEKGFIGSVVVLFLFGIIIASGAGVALRTPDKMGRLLCMGIVAMLFVHVFMNIAMTIGIMPIIGLPLPLLSYGGSFMVVMMSSLGIIQSVYIRSRRVSEFEHVS